MKKLILLLIVLSGISVHALAQTEGHRKTIYGSFLGNAPLGSFNFDMRLKPETNFGFGFSAGLGGSASYFGWKSITMGIPVAVNYLLGAGHHALELGLAGTPEFMLKKTDYGFDGTPPGVKERSVLFHSHANIGYRFQPLKDKGIMFNAVWAPAISFKNGGYNGFNKKSSLSNFGIGLGYSFK